MSEQVPDVSGLDDSYSKACEESRAAARRRMTHSIVQSIIGDIDYRGTARDDEVYWQILAIDEENGLPFDTTPDELYNLYRTNYQGEQL